MGQHASALDVCFFLFGGGEGRGPGGGGGGGAGVLKYTLSGDKLGEIIADYLLISNHVSLGGYLFTF